MYQRALPIQQCILAAGGHSRGRAKSYITLILQAIKKFARLRRPVYITETGIADKSDALRAEWAQSYFKAVGLLAWPLCWPVLMWLIPSLAKWLSSASSQPCNMSLRCMQVEHAVADGYDVRGLMYWTLMDNFEVRTQTPGTAAKLLRDATA